MSTTRVIRSRTPVAVIGLDKISVTPTSRASVTRELVEWPVTMMTWTNGVGLSGEFRSQRTKAIPPIGWDCDRRRDRR